MSHVKAAPQGAGAPDEITAEMIEAGMDAYEEWDAKNDYDLSRLVAEIYRRMERQRAGRNR
jgi:hypothetical protein